MVGDLKGTAVRVVRKEITCFGEELWVEFTKRSLVSSVRDGDGLSGSPSRAGVRSVSPGEWVPVAWLGCRERAHLSPPWLPPRRGASPRTSTSC